MLHAKETAFTFITFPASSKEKAFHLSQFILVEKYLKIDSLGVLSVAPGNRAICVITGDRNHAEEQGADAVLSHWARRQVSSQFSEEFLDGRKSFIFSWDKEHRAIHEEAILHYFDPSKKNKTFVPGKHRKQNKQVCLTWVGRYYLVHSI